MDILDKDLHRMVWPYDPWKDKRIVNVPLNYLRVFIRDTKKDDEKSPWIERAQAEIKRRHFIQDHVFITEHCVERMSQHFPGLYERYLRLSTKYKLKPESRPGQISFMKLLFKKALANGVTTKAEGNTSGAGNYHVKYRHFRWTYGLYGTSVKDGLVYEYKLLSIVPTGNKDYKFYTKRKK